MSTVEEESLVRTTSYEFSFDGLDVSDTLNDFVDGSTPILDNRSPDHPLSSGHPVPGARFANDIPIDFTSNTRTSNSGPRSAILLPRQAFQPYLRLFFSRLYPIFPIVDRHIFLDTFLTEEEQQKPLEVGEYAFLTALSAAVVLQLNVEDLGGISGPNSRQQATTSNPIETGLEPFLLIS